MVSGLEDAATTEILRTVPQRGPVLSRGVTLRFTSGPEAGSAITIDDLAHRQLSAGKSAACEVRLSDPSVSRRHFTLELEDEGLVLRDLGSSNRTFVNGAVVREGLLFGGETIRVGNTELTVELGTTQSAVSASAEAHFGGFIGASPVVRRLYARLERLAVLDIPLLFEGEAGTGKELLAEAVHAESARRAGPFVVFAPTGPQDSRSERVLFGDGTDPGLIEQAQGGTLFIDEILDVALPLQVKLARTIVNRTFRVAGTQAQKSLDVRLITASRRDLDREVQEGRFREELLELLVPGRVTVPPLRRRYGDIALLTKLFWTRYGGAPQALSPAMIQQFEQRSWMGNTRELAAAVAATLVNDKLEDLAPEEEQETGAAGSSGEPNDFIEGILRQALPYGKARALVSAAFDRRYFKAMLTAFEGNVTRAAAASGISRRYFYRLRTERQGIVDD